MKPRTEPEIILPSERIHRPTTLQTVGGRSEPPKPRELCSKLQLGVLGLALVSALAFTMDANNKVGFLDALLRRQLAWPVPLWLLLAAHGIVNIALGFLLIAFLGDILARLKTIRPQSGPIIFAFQCTIVPLSWWPFLLRPGRTDGIHPEYDAALEAESEQKRFAGDLPGRAWRGGAGG